MTYQELLDKFKPVRWNLVDYDDFSNRNWALSSVVRLHKEVIDMNGFSSCEECSAMAYYNVAYPCTTITTIAKEFGKWDSSMIYQQK